MTLYIAVAALVAAVVCLVLLIVLLVRQRGLDPAKLTDAVADEVTQREAIALNTVKTDLINEGRSNRVESAAMVNNSMKTYSDAQTTAINQQFRTFSEQNTAALNAIRATVQDQLSAMQKDNHAQLDQMRQTVDEKLQKTLNDRITQSFQLVNERLQEVYTGLGEMKTLASGVGDLKKVLSNVKTRGILGEIQLGSILTEILPPEQYEENIATKKGSKNVVEFAIKLPAEDDSFIYLPIDSKFPGDTYAALRDAIEDGDKERIDLCAKALITTIKNEAKDIRDKYIDPPNTTEFAIMFLPFEGLYSEVVNRGMVEELQRKYKVNIAGPSTMAALLNSLQMGFKTLAVQKRSSEVWDLLGSVKQEFDKFNDVLTATQMRLDQANKELDKLVGVRTRQIQRKLKDVQSPTMLTDFSEEN